MASRTNNTVDELNIVITTNAETAANAIGALAKSLDKLKTASSNAASPLKDIANSVKEMSSSVKSFSADTRKTTSAAETSIKKIKELSATFLGIKSSVDQGLTPANTGLAQMKTIAGKTNTELVKLKITGKDISASTFSELDTVFSDMKIDIETVNQKLKTTIQQMKRLSGFKVTSMGPKTPLSISDAPSLGVPISNKKTQKSVSLGTAPLGQKIKSNLTTEFQKTNDIMGKFGTTTNAIRTSLYQFTAGSESSETQLKSMQSQLKSLQSQLNKTFDPTLVKIMSAEISKITPKIQGAQKSQAFLSPPMTATRSIVSQGELGKVAQQKALSDRLSDFNKLNRQTEGFMGRLRTMGSRGSKSVRGLGGSFIQLRSSIFFAFFALNAVKVAFEQTIIRATNFVETQNLFNVAMRNNRKEADAFVASMQRAFGLNPERIMRYQATFFQVAESMGIANKNAYVLSETLTRLTFDIASLRNMELETVFEKMQAILTGQDKAIRSLGGSIQMTTLQEYALKLGLDKQVKSMTQAEKSLLRLYVFYRQSAIAQGDMSRTLMQPANLMRVLADQTAIAAEAIGSLFVGALAKVLPYIIYVVRGIGIMAKRMADFFGIDLKGMAGGAKELDINMGDTAENTDKATKAMKKLRDYTMGIDELNIVSKQTDDSGLGANAQDAAVMDDMIQKIQEAMNKLVEEPFIDMMNKIGKSFERLMRPIKPVTDALRNLWNNGLKQFSQFTFGSLLDFYNMILKPIASWTLGEGIPMLIDALNDLLTGIDYNKIRKALRGIWEAMKPIGTLTADAFEFILDEVLVPAGKWAANTLLPAVLDTLADAFKALSSILKGAKPVLESVFKNILKPLFKLTGGTVVGLLKIAGAFFEGIAAFADKNPKAFQAIVWTLIAFFTMKVSVSKITSLSRSLQGMLELLTTKTNPMNWKSVINVQNMKKAVGDAVAQAQLLWGEIFGYKGAGGKANIFVRATDALKRVGARFASFMSSTFPTLSAAAAKLWAATKTKIQVSWGNLKALGTTIGTAMANAPAWVQIAAPLMAAIIGAKIGYELYQWSKDKSWYWSMVKAISLGGLKVVEFFAIMIDKAARLFTFGKVDLGLRKGIQSEIARISQVNPQATAANNGQITYYGQEAANAFGQGVTNNLPVLINKGAVAGQTAADSFNKGVLKNAGIIRTTGINTGANFGTSATRGLNSKFNSATNAGKQFATAIYNGFASVANSTLAAMQSDVMMTTGQSIPMNRLRVMAFASGGMATKGQMFVAGEAGPELVGSYGGNPNTVMPLENSGFVQAVERAVYKATRTAMVETQSRGEVGLYVDGKKLGKAIEKATTGRGIKRNGQLVIT